MTRRGSAIYRRVVMDEIGRVLCTVVNHDQVIIKRYPRVIQVRGNQGYLGCGYSSIANN